MYENSKLWQRIMLDESDNKEAKGKLCNALKKVHEKAELLAKEICRYLPDFTVHDISHLDALWNMTDIFLPDDYPFNPAEVFVLGVSFLIHDLGMGLAAYSKGMEGIQNETIWKDTVASLCKKKGLAYNFDDIENIDADIRREATEVTLRTLHAEKAEQLGVMFWSVNGEQLYLLEDSDLRSGYGEIIGKIAASHGWSIEKAVEQLPESCGAPSFLPPDWGLDPLKLACVIRIADAINIDDSRAPKLLRALRAPNPYSDLHWIFQEKLSQPQIIDNRLAFSSKSAFSADERDAWWLCYDTLKWIDVEIRKVDAALLESGHPSFKCIGIHSIDNIADLVKRINVTGWQPVDTHIRATKVAHLVKTLGGSALYGNSPLIPLRELIQNASDAIRARRCLDGEDNNYGTITITIGELEGQKFVEVEDDGIGMSESTMTNTLLDFGNSFWQTNEMHNEFPGLEQTSFKSTGHFGIGFFSVLMWGEHVIVTSNRYDLARTDTKVLEFVTGIDKRPFLRNAKKAECIKNGGTRIRVYISDNDFMEEDLSDIAIEQLCPTIDCNIYTVRNNIRKRIITANDWMTIDPISLLKRCGEISDELIYRYPEYYAYMCYSVRPIFENEQCVGRIGITPFELSDISAVPSSLVTIGGLRSYNTGSNTIGFLIGDLESVSASRYTSTPFFTPASITNWAKEQITLLSKEKLPNEIILSFSMALYGVADVRNNVKITSFREELLNANEIVEASIKANQDTYYIIDIDGDDSKPEIREAYYNNVFLCYDCKMDWCNELYNTTYSTDYIEVSWIHSTTSSPNTKKISYSSPVYNIIKSIGTSWSISEDEIFKSVSYGLLDYDIICNNIMWGYVIKKPNK